ncbi:MAG: histidine kinase [Phaeodactylibacter sp.]|nr:histidine kinase [Phaeodactylibacter sp.]MCB9274107.1 histidine kinase [Lewinellaceae bacterium]
MSLRKLPIPYIYVILASLALGSLVGLRNYLYMMYYNEQDKFSWDRGWFIYVVNYLTWALLFPLVHLAVSRIQSRPAQSNLMLVSRIIGTGILLSLLHELISNMLFFPTLHLLGTREMTIETVRHMVGVLPAAVITRLIEFGIIYAILTAIELRRKYRTKQLELVQLEGQLSSAQLNALRLQLQPHFLFNTLNTISSLMEFDKKGAQKIVSQLGNLLRALLDQDQRNLVPLREELEFIKSYLNIEQVRFQDRLRIDYHIDGSILDALAPSLILQPLVENAIKHGFSNRTDEGHITTSCQKDGEHHICLCVRDDGKGNPRSEEALLKSGIGLKNIKDRLQLIYQDDYQFQVRTAAGEGFEAIIRIPYQRQQA